MLKKKNNTDMTSPLERLTFIHHKGGTGKTTSCINIAGWLTKMGQKVLVVDLDPQANSTTGLGVDLNSIDKSMYDVLLGECHLNDIVLKTTSGVYLAPADMKLLTVEAKLSQKSNAITCLNDTLQGINHYFDFVLIDSPPGSNLLMINSIVAARNIIIPMDTGVFSCETMEILNTLISNLEAELKISINIVMTLVKNFSSMFQFGVARSYKKLIRNFYTSRNIPSSVVCQIPFSKKIFYAQMRGLPISHYAPRSFVAKAYHRVAKNILYWESV